MYDLRSLVGEGEQVLSTSVRIDGNRNGVNGLLLTSEKLSNGFYLSPNNFPAYLGIEIRKVNSSGNEENLSAKVEIPATKQKFELPLQAREFGLSSLQSQTEVNNFLYKRVNAVQTSQVNTVNLDGVDYPLQSAIIKIWNEIQQLKKVNIGESMVRYSNDGVEVSKKLSEALTEITTALNQE